MLEAGWSMRRVGRTLGVSASVICRAYKRYREHGSARRTHGGGRQKQTTRQQDRYITLTALRNPSRSAKWIKERLQSASGVRVSDQTVRNRLHQSGLRSRRPAKRIPLKQRHREARLRSSEEHVRWTNAQWSPILFTDESRFCLDFFDGRVRVWRRPGTRYADQNVAEHDCYGGGSQMVACNEPRP